MRDALRARHSLPGDLCEPILSAYECFDRVEDDGCVVEPADGADAGPARGRGTRAAADASPSRAVGIEGRVAQALIAEL